MPTQDDPRDIDICNKCHQDRYAHPTVLTCVGHYNTPAEPQCKRREAVAKLARDNFECLFARAPMADHNGIGPTGDNQCLALLFVGELLREAIHTTNIQRRKA